MKRKKVHNHSRIPRNKPSFTFSLTVLAIFFTAFFALIAVIRFSGGVHVLGAQTVLLARETEVPERENADEVRKVEILPEKEHESENAEVIEKEKEEKVEDETLVDCEGADGMHKTVSYSVCKRIHEEMKSKEYSFTPLTKSPKKTNEKTDAIKKMQKEASSSAREIQKEEKKERTEISQNEVTKNEGEKKPFHLTIETDINNRSVLKRKNSKAVSDLPISIDTENNTVHVTTERGEQEIHVFPDTAVKNILEAKLLTNTETEVSSESGESMKKVVLTQVNDQAAFAVNGVSEKKVFGVFPVAFSKTVYVSAVDGTVVKTDETLLNKLLEAVSL